MKPRGNRAATIRTAWRTQAISDVVPRRTAGEPGLRLLFDTLIPVTGALCAVLLLFLWVREWDGSMRATVAPILAEIPRDGADPFAGTWREAQILSTYREPPPKRLAAPPPAAKALDGIDAKLVDKSMRFYRLRCASCHGDAGGGDGLAASMIQPRPRSFADRAWQDSVTNEQILNVMVKGGASAGRSPMMPASPDLKSKQELSETLVRLIRSLGESSGLSR